LIFFKHHLSPVRLPRCGATARCNQNNAT